MFALVVSGIAAVASWPRWLREVASVAPRGASPGLRRALAVAPFACLALLLAVLALFASFDVRDSPTYIFFYAVMGIGWVGAGMLVVPYFGVSARDDVVERSNRAALHALLGAMLGITLCFAGGNIGDGPGWWVVVFCGLLSTGALLGLWWLAERACRLSDAVTIDRDPASGLRLGAFLASAGLVLGRSVAGDWRSTDATIRDFVERGWPAAAIAVLAILLQKASAPSPERPARSELSALLPALLLLAAGVAWVAHLGDFE